MHTKFNSNYFHKIDKIEYWNYSVEEPKYKIAIVVLPERLQHYFGCLFEFWRVMKNLYTLTERKCFQILKNHKMIFPEGVTSWRRRK